MRPGSFVPGIMLGGLIFVLYTATRGNVAAPAPQVITRTIVRHEAGPAGSLETPNAQLVQDNLDLKHMLTMLAGAVAHTNDVDAAIASIKNGNKDKRAQPRPPPPPANPSTRKITMADIEAKIKGRASPVVQTQELLCKEACHAEFNTFTPRFREVVMLGRERFANQRVIIAGLVHNAETAIPGIYDHLKKTVKGARDHRIIMWENDSHDKTSEAMQRVCDVDDKAICVSKTGYDNPTAFGPFSRRRFELMAEFRNSLLEEIIGPNNGLSDWDVVLFVDMDMFGKAWLPGGYPESNSNGQGWQTDMIPTLFGYDDEWDVMCGNGVWNKGNYYDTLAYRDENIHDTLHFEDRLHAEMNNLKFRGAHMAPVRSCFGGIAAYKISSIIESSCKYIGGDCEHIGLNKCLHKRGYGRIFINPLLTFHYDSSDQGKCSIPCPG